MSPSEVRQALKESSKEYATVRGFEIKEERSSAIIFADVSHSFYDRSLFEISSCPKWLSRLDKSHQNIAGAKEMQSSNSSDALLMNIFCHPQIGKWKGVRDLLNWDGSPPEFGASPKIEKIGTSGDSTEIDMVLGNLYVEAKLSEEGFTEKLVEVVEKYPGLSRHFHVECLPKRGGKFLNYQILRNLLASIQNGKSHALFCDERRPDLTRAYLQTVSCLKDIGWRKRCRVVFWQEIARVSGNDLSEFLRLKYGIK